MGIVFPEGGEMARHPSQIYEALLEGLVLYLILRWLFRKHYHPGAVVWGADWLLRTIPIPRGILCVSPTPRSDSIWGRSRGVNY